MKYLAFDLSTSTGYAFNEGGTIHWGGKVFKRKSGRKTLPDDHLGIRQQHFAAWSRKVISLVKPNSIIVERFGHFESFAAVEICVGFQAIVLASASWAKIPVERVSPSELKKWATGKGNADKAAMRKAAMAMNPALLTANGDEIDAYLMIALAMAREKQNAQAVRMDAREAASETRDIINEHVYDIY